MWAVIANCQTDTNFVSSILMPAGIVSHNQDDILHSFCAFCRDLYQCKVNYQLNQLRDLLAPLKIRSLSSNDRKCLKLVISLTQLISLTQTDFGKL